MNKKRKDSGSQQRSAAAKERNQLAMARASNGLNIEPNDILSFSNFTRSEITVVESSL